MSRAKQRLRDKGIAANEVSASRFMHVPHTSLWIAPKGHALFDPRSTEPPDLEMAADVVARVQRGECPNTDAILVWEQGDRLIVGDGHRRALAIVHAHGEIGGSYPLMPLVEFFDGDEKAFLLARARRNDHDRFAKRDKPSTLAFRVKQLTAVGATEDEIADAMPKGITAAIVAALARWGSLAADARRRFDEGAPIELLAVVVDAPRDEQVQTLDKLIAKGIKSAAGATRARNKARDERDPWARRMSPRQILSVAEKLSAAGSPGSGALDGGKKVHDAAWMVAAGMWLAANKDPHGVLDLLPKPIADLIREARAVQGRRA